eukprot:6265705-Heterocapsa_arctica.AAC.1
MFVIHALTIPTRYILMVLLLKLEQVHMRGGVFGPQTTQHFKEHGPLTGRDQGSDRAEVIALVAALEKTTSCIEVITDNQYVRDTAKYLLAGGHVLKGEHSDLWQRVRDRIEKFIRIRWVKAHLK